ncbi:MAG: ABC transporter permease [Candidatus Cyclobacteriaceae bacterium M2_1C_046]
MLKNYLAIALRNLSKNKLFSFINIFGLALSLSVCMIIIMVVIGQTNQDRHNPDREKIYRIGSRWIKEGQRSNDYATSPLPLAQKLENEYPGVESAVRIRRGFGNGWVKVERDLNIPVAGFYVDHNFLEFFKYDLSYGDINTALKEPYSTVLTEQTALKLFNRTDVVGEVLEVGDLGKYTITGIIKSPLPKSHMVFEALASTSTLPQLETQNEFKGYLDSWDNYTAGWVYLKLDAEASEEQINSNFAEIISSITPEENNGKYEFFLQPLTAINPGPLMNNAIGPMMPMIVVYFLGGLCLIIMLTAGFNYTNLSIAKSLTRAKEVGVRKVSGASRKQLFAQFIIESVVIVLLAFVLGMVLLVTFFKPAFEGLLFADVLEWGVSLNSTAIAACLAFTIVVGILVGLLPASLLSAFNPTQALKGLTGKKIISKVGLRKTLLVSQFALSLIFIITMVLVNKQFNLLTTSDYGFNAENVLTLRVKNDNYSKLKTAIAKYSSIENVAAASHIPSAGTTRGESIKRKLSDEGRGVDYFVVDENYLDNLQISLVAGQNFPENITALEEERFVLINEKALEFYQFENAHAAINESLYLPDSAEVKILGVVENYHHQPMMMDVGPLVLKHTPEKYNVLQIRYAAGNREQAEKDINAAYLSIYPNRNVQLEPLNAEIKEFYDILFGDLIKIFALFSTLAIVIASMGLLGMVTYTVQLKLKEVSIRKVLGATSPQLVMVLSRGFILLLGIGILIAVPVAYFLNDIWLQHIAVRVNMNVEVIALGIGIILLFGIITIGSQTLRASLLNPVKFLKDE